MAACRRRSSSPSSRRGGLRIAYAIGSERQPAPPRRITMEEARMSDDAFAVLRTVPILRMFDVAKAREFYVDYCGFRVDWEHRFDAGAPLYLQVSLGDLVLHLSEHHGDACPGAAVRAEVRGVRAF